METFLKLVIVATGLSGYTAQLLLLRELLIVFSGNEFTIGMILANWLLTESLGSYFVGKTAEKLKNKVSMFVLLSTIFFLFLPIAVFITRNIKTILGISVGEGLGIIEIFLSSLLILSTVSIIHGASFTYGCKIYSELISQRIPSIAKVYIFETLGTILGGVVLTYLMIPYLNTFKIISIVGLINLILCFIFLSFESSRLSLRKFSAILCSLAIFIFLCLIFFAADKLHFWSIKTQWRKQKVLDYQNSIYSNICVVGHSGQYTFFIDGIPKIITPVADIMFVEEFVHFPLLLHKNPKNVVVISGGAGGVINEILKHSTVESIDYVELDPLILKLIKKYPTLLTEQELNNKKVHLKHTDARLFLRYTKKIYDVIFLGLSAPTDLQSNRFFTKEFFSLAKTKLTQDGIFVLTLPGSLTYISDELANLNKNIYNTLSAVFKNIYVLPGEGTNIFLSSDSEEVRKLTKELFIKRIEQRKLQSKIIVPRYIEYKLQPTWQEMFFRFIEKKTKKINSDFVASGMFYSLSYWNSLFSSYLTKFFRFVEKISLLKILIVLVCIWSTLLYLLKNKLKYVSVLGSVTTTGFSGMVSSLIIITAFQSIYGYVFYWIGMLTSSYMLGSTLGAWISTKKIQKDEKKLFMMTEFIVLCFSILLTLLLVWVRKHTEIEAHTTVLSVSFLLLSLINGIAVGLQFPVANSIYLKLTDDVSKTAGLLNSCDLLGGWFGGIILALVLPVIGLISSCIIVSVVKLLSFFSFVLTFKPLQK